MAAQDCIFCQIPADDDGDAVIYRDEHVYVIRDLYPQAPVHLLIIPLQHQDSLDDVGPDQVSSMGRIFTVAREMARREGVKESGYRLCLNQGRDGGQHVPHTHVHLLGGKVLPAPG